MIWFTFMTELRFPETPDKFFDRSDLQLRVHECLNPPDGLARLGTQE